ncbi:MAG: YkgJ family cysteine cluster protein [Pseudomonadota bacterium]|nr:YkgJ family cysteine cluster protein [Pseudomonadota bacterium]
MPIPGEKEGALESHPSEDLREEVAGGLRYTHTRASANTGKLLEVASFAYAAIELLAEKGLLEIAELDKRKAAVAERLMKKYTEDGLGAAYQDPEYDKYSFEKVVDIDCESRLHVCKAACCRLRFALSRQDVKEGIVQREFSHPYFIAHGADGYCRHLDRDGRRCSIHGIRPVPCRGYDCRQDKRIWSDFDRKLLSPEFEELFQSENRLEI